MALGTAYRLGDQRIGYFQDGYTANSGQPELTRALWKFLADHATHPLRVLLPDTPGYDDLDQFRGIGGDERGDVSFAEYLDGWPGWSKGWEASLYKPFMLTRWAYDDSTIDKWCGLGFVWFLLRLALTLVLLLVDLVLSSIFLAAQIA
jgi:hypothetical protein